MNRQSSKQSFHGRARLAATVALASLLALGTSGVRAEPTPAAQVEINHLLDFVAQSRCTFIRNGTEHSAAEARTHLSEKFDYVRKRVSTAEDFIKGVASESSMSGTPYRVRCGAAEMLARTWLADELRLFREKPVAKP